MNSKILYILLLFLLVIENSCKKKSPDDIGLPILPGNDLLNAKYVDTLLIIAHTVKADSLPSKNIAPTLLGAYNDPIFGVSSVSIFTQFSLSKANPDFGTNPFLDSVVLSLTYSKGQHYGMLVPQTFKVHELLQNIYRDSVYYSNKLLSYGMELGNTTIKPNLTDSVKIDSLKYPPHLRIHLDKSFFQNFLHNPSIYIDNTSLQEFFKGIFIVPTNTMPSGEGAILSIDLANSYSGLTFFYHNTTDTTSYKFLISKDFSTHSSLFNHDYSMTSDLLAQLKSSQDIQEDKVYVQSMAGVRTRIIIPYLKDLYNKGKVAINKAELILPVDVSSFAGADSVFYPHPQLLAAIENTTLGPMFMPDYFEGIDYFGGSYAATKYEYTFNIARYVQQVLNGTKENGALLIISNASQSTGNRTVLVGANKSFDNRMRLRITYTFLK